MSKRIRATIRLICDHCGNSYNKDLSEFKRNQRLQRDSYCSMICLLKVRQQKGTAAFVAKFKGTQPPQLRHTGDSCTPFRYYLRGETHKRHGNTLNCNYLKELWNKQQGRCALSGLPITLKALNTTSKQIGLTAASLDRIDSSKGYVEGNVQFICVGLNLAKGDRRDAEVQEFIRLLRGDDWDYKPSSLSYQIGKLIII